MNFLITFSAILNIIIIIYLFKLYSFLSNKYIIELEIKDKGLGLWYKMAIDMFTVRMGFWTLSLSLFILMLLFVCIYLPVILAYYKYEERQGRVYQVSNRDSFIQ